MAKLGKIPTKRRGRTYKVTTVQELEQLFAEGDGIVLMNNKGLTAAEATELRSKMRENKVAVKIAKNTLIRIAEGKTPLPGLESPRESMVVKQSAIDASGRAYTRTWLNNRNLP